MVVSDLLGNPKGTLSLSDHLVTSPLDTQRFGVTVARVASSSEQGEPGRIEGLAEEARRRRFDLVIARCGVHRIDLVHGLEGQGAKLMDVHVKYARSLPYDGPDVEIGPSLAIREAAPDDVSEIVDLARDSFAGYIGHYHADPRLDSRDADEVYASWARRSCTETDVADAVFIARSQDLVVGFSTVKLHGRVARGVLDAVDAASRGQGVYSALNLRRMRWAFEQGAEKMVVETHLGNFGAQAGLSRLGFTLRDAEYTFHLWIND